MPRYHNTNNAAEGRGKTLGMEGDNILILLGALLLGITILFSMHRAGYPLYMKFGLPALVVVFALIWVFGFRQGKPPSYDYDWFMTQLNGREWTPDSKSKMEHPFLSRQQEDSN